jgi:HEPN domain-containing protein
MKKVDLLQRAEADLKMSEIALSQAVSDEMFLDIAAYHLQQCIEKTLKYVLAQNGIEFKKTHEIDELCEQFDEDHLIYPSWVYDNHAVLNKYATTTRYGESIVGNVRLITDLVQKAHEYIQAQREMLNVTGEEDDGE